MSFIMMTCAGTMQQVNNEASLNVSHFRLQFLIYTHKPEAMGKIKNKFTSLQTPYGVLIESFR